MPSTKSIYLILISFTVMNIISAQENSENWIPTDKMYGSKIYIDVEGLAEYTGDDFWVWALQENDPPLELEGINRDIYKTKTYFLINKKLRKYSLAEVIYYDEDDNVITSFSYKLNQTIPKFRYNYPIYDGSDMDFIFNKCLDYVGTNDVE